MKRAVTVYAEMTPNPNTIKFVSDIMLMNGGETADFLTPEEAKGCSSMASALFNFPFVKSMFFANNFVTITKTDSIEWSMITNDLRDFVRAWLQENDDVVEVLPNAREVETSGGAVNPRKTVTEKAELNSEADKMIYDLLEEYVRPAVESDGGAIDFQNFDPVTGIVTVVLRGACSGCPSSTATLKGGIESLLKANMPDVREVVALEG
jgi:Fe-S cluster biogenesis protein NfuA